ncbi:type II secretion system protein [Fictibacillus sp. UD]|uniref:type II secretion system protein n=1 Tax=Fictibacillus sp. UD TaxID=3038777 RepID=UPI003746DD63
MVNKLLKKYAKNEKGLTLIELLVVIVILGIIAAIAVVSIGNIIGDTKGKAKVTEAVQIINAAKLKHSTEGSIPDTGWGNEQLKEYVSNVKDDDYTVKWNKTSKVYTITKHDSDVVVGKTANAEVEESVLTQYLD